jgi:hypothetical protein
MNNTIIDRISSLYNDLIYLCEIRGELDPETNEKTEQSIAKLMAELDVLEKNYA